MPGIATGAEETVVERAGRGIETGLIAELAADAAAGSTLEVWGLIAGEAFAVEGGSLVAEPPSSLAASLPPGGSATARLTGLPGAGLALVASDVAAVSGAPATVCVDRLPML